MNDATAVLRTIRPFSELSEETIDRIVGQSRIRRFDRHDLVVQPGADRDHAVMVLQGLVVVGECTPDGVDVIDHLCGPGTLIGVLDILDPCSNAEFARALSKASAMITPSLILRGEAERNPRFALSLGNAAARAARHTRRLLAERRCLGVTERLWLHLRALAEGLGTPARDSPGRVIDPHLRQQDLADLVGASRETVSKSMAELASLGLVRTQHGRVVVTEVQPSRRDRTHAVVTA